MNYKEIIIVGGGLAGLTAAIHLSLDGNKVLLFETDRYPRHKVCGEYVSNEVRPYLKRLGIDPFKIGAVHISQFEISTLDGYKVNTRLPLGGMGISRFGLDNMLYERALELGVHFVFDKVLDIVFEDNSFKVRTKVYGDFKGSIVLGAYGKRSVLDKKLKRDFSFQKEVWLGVKAHYEYPYFPDNLVGLHNFEGGYGGLSKTEMGTVNFCYLTHYQSFKKHKDINEFNIKVVSNNKYLDTFFSKSKLVFDQAQSIAQISFEKKNSVENHILMIGDTAGLIHPLCGNGMAMAIHSAKIVSELLLLHKQNSKFNRDDLENNYRRIWNEIFASRLWLGRTLQHVLMHRSLVNIGVKTIGTSGSLLRGIIGKTHGKIIN